MTNEQMSPLAACRLAAGFTQESLAEQLSIDRSTIGRWERGAQAPQPWQRPDLATSLRISLAELDDILRRTKPPTEAEPAATAAPNGALAAEVQRSQQEWLRVRNAPGVRGRELTELAAWLYPESHRAPGGHVLAGPGWLFATLVETNDEGRVIGRGGRTDMPFTDEAIDRLDPRLSASALTLLHLAWRDRELLLRG